MTDPRNVAHDKKVQQVKKHHGEPVAPTAEHAPQPGKKPHRKHGPTGDERLPGDAGEADPSHAEQSTGSQGASE